MLRHRHFALQGHATANNPLSPLSIPQVFAKIFPFQGTARTQLRHTCPHGVPSLRNHEKGRVARLT